jgi:hypothetical protein
MSAIEKAEDVNGRLAVLGITRWVCPYTVTGGGVFPPNGAVGVTEERQRMLEHSV